MPTKENVNIHIMNLIYELYIKVEKAKETEAAQKKWKKKAKHTDDIKPLSRFAILSEGMKKLENIQLFSVDDFESVWKLVEAKNFFSNSAVLNHFEFILTTIFLTLIQRCLAILKLSCN